MNPLQMNEQGNKGEKAENVMKKEVISTLYEAKEKSYSLLDDHIAPSIVNAGLTS